MCTSLRCGQLLKIDGGQWVIDTQTYVVWNLIGIDGKDHVWSEECRKTV